MKLPWHFPLVLLLTCMIAPSMAAVQIVNLAPGVLEAAEALPARRAAVLAEHLAPLSDLYRDLLGISDLDAASQQYAGSLEAQRPGLKPLSDTGSLEVQLRLHVGAFRSAFPRFDATHLSIYVLPSFGRFQAQSRMQQGQPTLLLDTAFFATMAAGSIPRPFVHHELFHLYHYQLRPDVGEGAEAFFRAGRAPSLGTLLWVEGLAVHVARQLSPGAPDSQLFPSADIVPATHAQYPLLLRRVTDHVDDATVGAICQFFYFPCTDGKDPIPLNSGYVVGERLVDQMLKRRSLEAVMLLKAGEIPAAVRQAAAKERAAAPASG